MIHIVYILHHVRVIDKENDISDIKLLGIYSSEENANRAIERYKKLEGFASYPECFSVDAYELNVDTNFTDGFFPWTD